MFSRSVPLGFSDPETAMRCLHVSPGVNTWSTCRSTKLIENMLSYSLLRINAVTNKEFLKLLVGNQPADEIINHSGQCVIATDTFVKRFLLGPYRYRDRQQQRK